MNHLFKNPTVNGSFEEQGQEVSEMLEQELTKPYRKRDYDKIEELLNKYTAMNHLDEQIEKVSEQGIQKVIAQTRKRKTRIRKYRPLLTVAVLALILVTVNVISVTAVDESIFSVIVNFAKTNFSVDFFSSEVPEESVLHLPVTDDDTYGMIEECIKNGIEPETPHYLPDDYVMTLCTNNMGIPSYVKYNKFIFTNKNNKNSHIFFNYELYENAEFIKNTRFSNIEHNLTEIQLNGKTAILAEEKKDKQFTIVYRIDNLLISIFTQEVPAEEVYKVLNSMQ